MSPRRRSPMPLPFFQEEPDDIHVQLRRSRETDAIWPRCAGRGLSDAQRRWPAKWHDPRDRCVTVQHGDGLAAAHRAQILAQARLEFRDTDFLHGHIMTRSSHFGKASRRTVLRQRVLPVRESDAQQTPRSSQSAPLLS